jgi:predicted RNA-binding protein with PIN domain
MPPPPPPPTRLPDTVAPGTAEEADLLLSAGRLVAVDGYNVTLQHRPQLDLAGQREWLIRRLATLAAQRRVRPVVVFDGERASAARPLTGVREVEVRFTGAGITADDELLFLVEALPDDEPVLAVTDDRELSARLAARGVDVVGTGPFVWATPG